MNIYCLSWKLFSLGDAGKEQPPQLHLTLPASSPCFCCSGQVTSDIHCNLWGLESCQAGIKCSICWSVLAAFQLKPWWFEGLSCSFNWISYPLVLPLTLGGGVQAWVIGVPAFKRRGPCRVGSVNHPPGEGKRCRDQRLRESAGCPCPPPASTHRSPYPSGDLQKWNTTARASCCCKISTYHGECASLLNTLGQPSLILRVRRKLGCRYDQV